MADSANFERDIVRKVNRLEQQVSLLRTLFIATKTNQIPLAKSTLDKSRRRRLVEQELLEQESGHAEGERRVLETEEFLLEALLKDSIWAEPQGDNLNGLGESSPAPKPKSKVTIEEEPQISASINLANSMKVAPDVEVIPTPTGVKNFSKLELITKPGQISRLGNKNLQASTSSSSSGWIKPKSYPQKPHVKKQNYSVIPEISGASAISKQTPERPGSPWPVYGTRTESGQTEKRLFPGRVDDGSDIFVIPQRPVDRLKLVENCGKKVRFGSAPSSQELSVPVPTTGMKRKSEQMYNDIFGNNSFLRRPTGTSNPVVKTMILMENEENESVSIWGNDSVFRDSAVNSHMDLDLTEKPKTNEKRLPLSTPDSPRRQSVLWIRNKETNEIGHKKEGNFRSTQELVRDFDKIPRTSPSKPNFKFKPEHPVRMKVERRKLPGWDCPECQNYWDGLASQLGAEQLQKLKDKCSKHRSEHQEAEYLENTPPLYWRTDFPSTQELPHVDGVRSPPR